jgi:hypothetical protein
MNEAVSDEICELRISLVRSNQNFNVMLLAGLELSLVKGGACLL